jgi:hypothetical protein
MEMDKKDGVVETGSSSGGRLGKATLLAVFFFLFTKTRWKDGEDGLSLLAVRGGHRQLRKGGAWGWKTSMNAKARGPLTSGL